VASGAGAWGAGGGAGGGGKGGGAGSLFLGADKGSRALLPLRPSPLTQGCKTGPCSAGAPFPPCPPVAEGGWGERGAASPLVRCVPGQGGSGGGLGGQELDRADSRGSGSAVKLKWQDFAQSFRRKWAVLGWESAAGGGGVSREAELVLGPSSSLSLDPRPTPTLEHVFASFSNLRRHREGYGSDEDEVRRPVLDRNGQSRQFF